MSNNKIHTRSIYRLGKFSVKNFSSLRKCDRPKFLGGTYRIGWKFLVAACPRLVRLDLFYSIHTDWDFARTFTFYFSYISLRFHFLVTVNRSSGKTNPRVRPLSQCTPMFHSPPVHLLTPVTVPTVPGSMAQGSEPIRTSVTRSPIQAGGVLGCCVFMYVL